jgi:transcription-repair coupling factor (superfamily II helicase)
MNLSPLLPLLRGTPSLAAVLTALNSGRSLTLGLADGAKAAALAALLAEWPDPALIVVSRADRAQALAEELAAWLGQPERIVPFAERDPLPYERLAPDQEAVRDRLSVLALLTAGQGAAIIIASVKALAQRTLSPQELRDSTFGLTVGQVLDTEGFMARLVALGYAVDPLVDRPGEASRRGGIIDVFPPQSELPIRIELSGRWVESLRLFDPATQRSLRPVEAVEIGPAREAILPSPRTQAVARGSCLGADHFDVPFLAQAILIRHLPPSALLVCDEYSDLAAVLDDLQQETVATRRELQERGELPQDLPLPFASWREVVEVVEGHGRRLYLSRWPSGEEPFDSPQGRPGALRLAFGPAVAYGGQLRRLVAEGVSGLGRGRRLVAVSQQAQRLAELFAEEGLATAAQTELSVPPQDLALVQGSLPSGWCLQEGELNLSLITDTEIFGFTKQRRVQPRRGLSREAFLAQLSPGDYIVHIEHGIARFAGLVRLEIDGRQREYLDLQYAEGDRLFVPTEQMDRVRRYVGPGDHEPRVTRLGSGDWQRIKARVRRAVQKLARELLSLYASRELIPGHAYPSDTPWQLELEASFPYLETPDQLAAIAEVKRDMEMARPMDRLVCGDVGYGKTEVAIRAAFKVVLDGRQVALLVPTTVLAQQHLQTFRQRFAPFPVRVDMLSRFRSEAEQRRIIDELAQGAVDIAIGTHRLLQRDVQFKDLGLVIIDEEQRFGVVHKEHLKKLRREIDVLTLSATPIPRTLYMALGGIRDMSAMETPPEERLPIKTYVSEFDERLVREAIVRELERGGQVYFVHNRVRSIEQVASRVQEIVPEASVVVAHGQMPEQELEQVMLDFVAGRVDVLVCTTIIESGLDIPNVSTIVVNQADRLGLAQLYQLRGRVGRGIHRAYAYLLYDRKGRLTEAAQKRLQTIFEATELGAGFQIALRDLEIRGAGNLLGPQQSGYIAAVGFDLYCRLLAEAAARLRAMRKGKPPPPGAPPASIDLPISAHVPESYVPDLNLRLQELADRFGPPPPDVGNLLYVVRLRALALQAGVQSIASEDGQIVVRLKEGETVPRKALAGRVPQGVHLGHTLARVDIGVLGQSWPVILAGVMHTLAGAGHGHWRQQAYRSTDLANGPALGINVEQETPPKLGPHPTDK